MLKSLWLFSNKGFYTMLATIINAVVILIGGALGSFFGDRINKKYTTGIMAVMGFTVAAIGIQSAAGIKSFLVCVVSIAVGTLIGMLLRLDDRINDLGDWAKRKLERTSFGNGPFSQGFVTCTLLFCSGSMAILGSIRAGLDHEYSILLTKSVIDGITAMAFGSALGAGTMFAAIPVFLYQGAITLLAGAVEPVLTPDIVNEMSGVGGPIFLALSCNMLHLGKENFKIGDMIPSVFLPILFVPLAKATGLF